MSSTIPTPETVPTAEPTPDVVPAAEPAPLSAEKLRACAIARGEVVDDDAEPLGRITAAKKDLNSRGNGAHWYRMRLTPTGFSYLSDERLPSGTFLASDRRCTIESEVFAGDLTITHDYGKGVDPNARLWTHQREDGTMIYADCAVTRTRDGKLRITLPDGTKIVRPNPRAK